MRNNYKIMIFVLLMFFSFGAFSVSGRPIGGSSANNAAFGWLRSRARAFGLNGAEIKGFSRIEHEGDVIAYVFNLNPSGFVVVASNDKVEPIVSFSREGYFDPLVHREFADMLISDLSLRYIEYKDNEKSGSAGGLSVVWEKLSESGSYDLGGGNAVDEISDVRVAPFLETKWGQSSDDGSLSGELCYNYYTPNNYPAGCVATAVAQIVRYFEYPVVGVGSLFNSIEVDGEVVSPYPYLRGGDGFGGAYDYELMVGVTSNGVTEAQRSAIGGLLFDCGVALGSSYWESNTSAMLSNAKPALEYYFDYNSASGGWDEFSLMNGLVEMINPNLDAGKPVFIGIADSNFSNGHAAVVDGYGFAGDIMYHHLNMGWTGLSDIWYSLPNINTGSGLVYSAITECIYNIYPVGGGEIVSGRVVDEGGNPIAGVEVSAYLESGIVGGMAITDENGIYAITGLGSGLELGLVAVKNGLYFRSSGVVTGSSGLYSDVSGNCWGADFVGYTHTVMPSANDVVVSVNPGNAIIIKLDAYDDGYKNNMEQVDVMYSINSLPQFGTLSDPGFGVIRSVPYIVQNDAGEVAYQSFLTQGLSDSFKYCGEDGGSAPFGGCSGDAVVRIESYYFRENFNYANASSGLPVGWDEYDGGNDGLHWFYVDPASRAYSYWNGNIFMVASQFMGGAAAHESLISPVIDFSMGLINSVNLEFSHKLVDTSGVGEARIEVSVDDGQSYMIVDTYTTEAYGRAIVDLSNVQGLIGSSSVRIKFTYVNSDYSVGDYWFWGIDDMVVTIDGTSFKKGDLDGDGDVDIIDVQLLTSQWLVEGEGIKADLNSDGIVNYLDYSEMLKVWRAVPAPPNNPSA